MAQNKNNTDLAELLLQCVGQPDPMLSMLEWLCAQLMEAEVSGQVGAGKSERADSRSGYRCGYRPRRLDTRMGTMYLMVPKIRQGGYIPFFVTERKRSETALIQVVQEESRDSYRLLFQSLKERGLTTPQLIISDANLGLVTAIQEGFPGASWQRCKVHFMRNIPAHIPQKDKKFFAAELKEIWLTPSAESARKRAAEPADKYERCFPKAIRCLEDGLEDSLAFYAFPQLDSRKISSSNMLKRLNKEIRRRTSVVGIFLNEEAYIRLVTTYLMEYAEDWSVSRAYLSEDSIQTLLQAVA
ncbi:IS256 family transposase [Hominenteromicrobium sp.]|uniref:IS256 family transposase n=1 Tax=Hominenteromicrobium sp. TaxID=3073581 RepID=UPI003AB12219